MYHLSDDNLDKLFGGLKDLEREPDSMLWSEISQQLPNSGFLNWGPRHFNIYYAAAGITALVTFFFVSLNQTPKQTGKIRSLTTYEKVGETPSLVQEETPQQPQEQRNTPIAPHENPVEQKADSSQLLVEPIKTVEIPEPIKTQAPDSVPVRKIKPKTIVKIVRRDTVRVSDTIAVRRKRRNN